MSRTQHRTCNLCEAMCGVTITTGLDLDGETEIVASIKGDHDDPFSRGHVCPKAVALAEGVELALLGRQAIDDDAAQTGPMLAALLDWPQATFAAGLEFVGPVVRVEREIDAGHDALMKSPGHRANILQRDVRRLGVGIVANSTWDFWITEMFARD